MLRARKPLELDLYDELVIEATLSDMIRRAAQPFQPLARPKPVGFIQWFFKL